MIANIFRTKKPEPAQGPVPFEPAAVSAGQLASASNQPFASIYQLGIGNTRLDAISFATLHRCVSLIAGMSAQMITGGSLRVLDRASGDRVDTPLTRQAVALLSVRPDGYTPGHTFIEDAMTDLLLDGNSLMLVERTAGRAARLTRLDPNSALASKTADGRLMYEAIPFDSDDGVLSVYDSQQIVHARWALLGGSSSITRRYFATPIVQVLRPAISIGRFVDDHVKQFFEAGGGGSQIGVSFERELTPEQLEDVQDFLNQKTSGRGGPLVLGMGAKFDNIGVSASDAETQALRQFQVDEVARVYGVPPPVIGSNMSAWGSAIESLSRGLYKFGVRQHVDRMLAPLSNAMLPAEQRFDIDNFELLRGDSNALSTMTTALGGDAQRPAIATVEELRVMAGLPRDGAPDDRRVFGGSGRVTEEPS